MDCLVLLERRRQRSTVARVAVDVPWDVVEADVDDEHVGPRDRLLAPRGVEPAQQALDVQVPLGQVHCGHRVTGRGRERVPVLPEEAGAHEALLRDWPRLRGWLEEDRAGRAIQAHLIDAAGAWDAAGRPDAELYRGDRLAAAAAWAGANPAALTAVERDFVDAASLSAERAVAAAEAQVVQERRTSRRLRSSLVGAALLLVFALVAGGLFLVQRTTAQREAAAARAAALGSTAVLTESLDQALLLAVEARHIDDSPATRDALLATLLRQPELREVWSLDDEIWFFRPVPSPDGQRVAIYHGGPAVDVWDIASGERLWRAGFPDRGDVEIPQEARWTPDGGTVLVTTKDFGGPR